MHSIGLPRTCLGFTNMLFFVMSLVGCAICVWCVINTDFFRDVNYTVTKSSLVSVIANFVNLKLWFTPMTTILIPITILVMMTSCCGILGAGCKVKCATKSYILLVTVVSSVALWLFFVSGIYNIYTKNEKTRRYLQLNIRDYYGKENDFITYVWDYIMVNYECCGVVSYRDFVNSNWQKANTDKLFPIQCCKLENKTGLVPFSKDCPKSDAPNIQSNKEIGCFYILSKSVADNKGKFIFCFIFLIFIYLILIFFAFCIIRGQPLISSMTGGLSSFLPAKTQVDENKVNPSYSSLENMMFVEEPPKKIVKVVSAVNPFQSYKFTPHSYGSGDVALPHNIRSQK